MSINGGGNLYPNWLGSATLTIPNNQLVVNGRVVNAVPTVYLTNQSVSSVTANTRTLMYTLPGTYAAGVYAIAAEFQTQNTSGGQTTYATGDSVDFTVQGIGDVNPDYAECLYKPFYASSTDGGANAGTSGVTKQAPTGLTAITNDNTSIGVYVKYNTATVGTITMTFTLTTLSIQKIY